MVAASLDSAILDFSKVKDGGMHNPTHMEPGDYLGVISNVTAGESNSGNAQWVYTIALASNKRATYGYYCVLDEKSLWKLRNIFVAAGVSVPKSRVRVDPKKIVGRQIGIVLEDDEYEGRVRSKITQVMPKEELEQSVPDVTDEDETAQDYAEAYGDSMSAPEPDVDSTTDPEAPVSEGDTEAFDL